MKRLIVCDALSIAFFVTALDPGSGWRGGLAAVLALLMALIAFFGFVSLFAKEIRKIPTLF